jgi:glycosyltransferase 2 family protein
LSGRSRFVVARRMLLAIAVSGGALAWFLSGVEWAPLGRTLATVRLEWVAVASTILLGEFVLRAVRWRVLLRPLGTTARTRDLFAAQVIGAAANTLLPLRAGEVAKPVVAARRTGAPLPAVVATAVMERVYDLLGLVSVLVVMAAVLPGQPGTSGEEAVLVANLKLYGGLFGLIAAVCMTIFFVLATRKSAARHLFARILSIAPSKVQQPFMGLFDGFVAGLGNTRDPKGLVQAGLLSIMLWLNGALAIYCLFHAFDMALPFGAACFTAVAIALTVALPQAPGYLGVFHVAMEKTMLLWGQDAVVAQGFAIVFWAVSFLPVTLIGVLATWREGLHLRNIGDEARRLGAQSTTPPAEPPAP